MKSETTAKARPGRRRIWLLVLIALPLLFGARWLLNVASGPQTQWLEVMRDDLVLGVDVEGKLQAVETTLLGPPQTRETWQFKIASMAPEGKQIEKGARVLSFDTSELMQNMQEASAERDAARKRVEQREQELTVQRRADELALVTARAAEGKARLKADVPGEMQAATELAQVRLDLELAEKKVLYLESRRESSRLSMEATLGALRAQASQAEQRLEQIQQAVNQMTVTAPTGGTVIYVTDWREDKKRVGDSCWRGEHVIELPVLDLMQAMGRVHESDGGKVTEGQRVTFRLDAHPDVEFSGKVASIWKTVQRESWRSPLKVVRLEVDLDETDTQRMRPGMRFRGRIETERVKDALVVDAEAVFLKPEGPVVYRKTFFGFEVVSVELGQRNQDNVEVLSGLTEGDSIAAVDLQERSPRS